MVNAIDCFGQVEEYSDIRVVVVQTVHYFVDQRGEFC